MKQKQPIIYIPDEIYTNFMEVKNRKHSRRYFVSKQQPVQRRGWKKSKRNTGS